MFDLAIIGGGIVGLSTGMSFLNRFPNSRIVIIEKETDWATHQTGHNSGVIHSGIYYKPGSFKARFAKEGNKAMVDFCEKHGITYDVCGKVIVAAEKAELPLLDRLYERGLQNGLQVRKVDSSELKEIEPHVNGLGAIQVKDSGIVDYVQVAHKFAELIRDGGGELRLSTTVEKIAETENEVVIETNRGTIHSRFLVNCAGLQSDRIARMAGLYTDMKIVPFRGEYYTLSPEKRYLVNHLIYPVPNPDFPFLGVHFTRMINGEVHAGPNAVLAFKREGYSKQNIDVKDLVEVLSYSGFWKLAMPNMKEGMKELIRSFSKKAFLNSLRRLIPELNESDIVPTEAGVRAQALKHDGSMVDDFAIFPGKSSLHVCNAPSPAATASIMIGNEIVNRISERIAGRTHVQVTM
ncbi:L-2-hydroxyglutarate oxidase [Pueribacillus theae]|uniref:L-2-hydroxyglutarate oxidase n=1 Tax=Pueribacillus theae TaxID=2171751 RepID=A0A2U1JPE2_9BACI|nr:L-2-hydroxyglutarate oxidase [Pueribacillus theae]PWA07046.1 L-2-hydroxyglutarate oxidase [Pueribacillus theae]